MYLLREFDRLFDDVLENLYTETPKKDIEYEFPLPGVSKDNCKLNVEKTRYGYLLRIEATDARGRKISRRIQSIPEHYDIKNIKARIMDGLLTVDVPLKKEEKEEKLLEVKLE